MSTPFNPFQSGAPSAPPGSATPAEALAPLQVAQPPIALLAGAGVAAVAGVVVAAIGWERWIAAIGWALAGPLAIVLMGAFVGIDTRRRAEPVYLRPGWIGGAYVAVVVLSAIGIIVGSTGFALWVGRQ